MREVKLLTMDFRPFIVIKYIIFVRIFTILHVFMPSQKAQIKESVGGHLGESDEMSIRKENECGQSNRNKKDWCC